MIFKITSFIFGSGVLATAINRKMFIEVSHASDPGAGPSRIRSSSRQAGDNASQARSNRSKDMPYAGPSGDQDKESLSEWNESWDNKPALSSKGDQGVRHIILIRHGQYKMHDDDKYCLLTKTGEKQAKELGKYLRKFKNKLEVDFTNVYHSGMTRARQTCLLAWGKVPYWQKYNMDQEVVLPDLREINPFPSDYHDDPKAFHKSKKTQERRENLDRLFRRHFSRPTDNKATLELYFCHANVIRYLTLKFLQLPLNSWRHFQLHHCSITHISIKHNGHVTCHAFGDVGFFGKKKRRTLNNVEKSHHGGLSSRTAD